ncbi:MAG: DUF2834 domain-containing protein [Sandaracinaceae bacterium]|nr:MAG: DUF2834 domain-containing protein [Sandaracinaceae bacterium]
MKSLRLGPVWGLIALAALGVTWTQNIQWMMANPGASPWKFVTDGFVNHAAASLSWDLLLLTAACIVFMVIEARKHGVRFLWAYIVFAFAIAISVTFPLFLWARERAMAKVT